MQEQTQYRTGFTLIELVVVIAVVGILALVSVVGYGAWRESVMRKAVQSDLQMAALAMENAKNFSSGYPSSVPTTFQASSEVTVTFSSGSDTAFCLNGRSTQNSAIQYYISNTEKQPIQGSCAVAAIPIQTVTAANCSTDRTLTFDARDNHTYWVQKLTDGKCWMLTNLAYAGGGTNTYSDVKSIQNGTSDAARVYDNPRYFIYPSASPTVNPATPSIDISGSDTSSYGYLYNWCAAMGAQLATAACANATTPAPNVALSICPSGWRLPTGTASTGEFTQLNDTVNGGQTTTADGLRDTWLGQRAGRWSAGFISANVAYYWSSTQSSATNATYLNFTTASVVPSQANIKGYGLSVRCVAN